MKRKNFWWWILIASFLILSVWYLVPTFRYYSYSKEYRKNPENEEKVQGMLKKALKLGLDLQGGVRMLLEIDMPNLIEQLASNEDERFDALVKTVNAASEKPENRDKDYIAIFIEEAQNQNIPLDIYFERDKRRDERNSVREVDQYLRDEIDMGITQALEIIRNRVDQWGVSEPSIQKQGAHRIAVELAGIDDVKRAQELVGKTAKLEFKLLKSEEVVDEVFNVLDRVMLQTKGLDISKLSSSDTVQTAQGQSTQIKKDTVQDTTGIAGQKSKSEMPFRLLLADISMYKGWVGVPEKNVPVVKRLLMSEDIKKVIPQDAFFYWDANPIIHSDGSKYFELYLLERNAVLSGDVITDARVVIGQGYDPKTAGKPVVSMEMNKFGGKEWSRITGANKGKRIAIVLDDIVFSAPVVMSQIPDGRSQIEGIGDMNEAKDLSIVLRSGAFSAKMTTISVSTIGAALGADSVRKGTIAAILSFVTVALFMILYYKIAGAYADVALFLNVVFITACLAGFHATLTMPGIAGLILTVGMAVDANVLINERIREELTTGKTVRAAVDAGYARAFITILDSNLTTLIAAIVLLQYGTGPVKGFAIVLSIGIVSSMFTAVVVTRCIFDFINEKFNLQKISI